jgi:putative ABC transport system permease protein
MLKPRWRKVLRDIWMHKARTLLVVLAIATGMVAAGTLLDAWALVRRATAETYLASHPVSATLKIDVVDAELLAQVRALPDVGAARARRTLVATQRDNGARRTVLLYALDDFNAQQIGRLQPELGAWPPADANVIIERSSLDFSGARIGEPIMLAVGNSEPRALPVTGIVRDVSLAPGWMDHVVYGFVTPATLAQLGEPASFNELQFVVRDASLDRESVRRIAYQVKALAQTRGRQVSNVEVPVPGQHMHAAQMDSLMLVQGAFGLLTLLVCAFLIVNLIGAMLAGQAREIGVMKTLGASDGQIITMYLTLALAIGVFASAIALPAAIALGRQYAGLKADMLNFPIAGYAIPWWAIALQLVVGSLLPVTAAAIPVIRACRVSVCAALRDTGIATGTGLHLHRTIALAGLSRPLLLSLNNAFRRRQRMLLTLLALVAGGAVYLGADNLRIAVRGSVDLLFSSQRYDVLLRLSDAHQAEKIEATALATPGIAGAEAWVTASASVAHADGALGNRFALVALLPESTMVVPVIDSGRWLNASDQNALVVASSLLKDEPGLAVGATLTLVVDGTQAKWTVVGVVDSGPQPLAYAPRGVLNALRGDNRASTLAVATASRSATSQLDAILRLRGALDQAGMPVAGSQLLSESRRVFEDHLLMVVDFLGVMAWVMIAVGGMGLASTMSLAVLERTREIGVMRAIGARHHAIMTMIQTEGMVIAVLSWIVSLPVSVPMSVALASAFGRVMFPVPTHYVPDVAGALSWLALVAIVSVLACAWPALSAMRIPTARALSYE